MPSLASMRTKAKEAGLMRLDKLIAKRPYIPTNDFPIPVKELCERFKKLYTGCVNGVMREACLLDQNLPHDILPRRDERVLCYEVLLRAEGIARNEADIFSRVRQGDTISEIIDRGGYF